MIKILCIEDEALIRQQIVEELQDEGYYVIEAVDGQDGLDKIIEHKPDLVISDINMPRMDGHKLLLRLRQDFPQFADMPFIFLTAYSNRDDMLHGFELGVDDYLTKPIDFDILLSKINARLGQVQRIQKKNNQQLEYIAYHDTLTGLPNRLFFQERLDLALQRTHQGEKFAVLFLDLFRFKNINDTLGHLVGDELLKQVAERLNACISESDTVARMGGDEFSIIHTENRQPEGALTLSNKIHQALKPPFDLNGYQVYIDAGIGIAIAPDHGDSQERLLTNADLALYRAKRMGPDHHCVFDLEMGARVKARRVMEVDLRKAFEKGEFELHYQPIYDVFDNTLVSFEALLRWNHPRKEVVSPEIFIGLAEKIGLINQLGEWVINQACAEAATWPKHIKVAVNLSPLQFKNDKLPLLVAAALAKSGLTASRLELEITESTIMENEQKTLASLLQLKALGVSLAMDDFGTGYSSLSYLQTFPFDKIKIDRSFIQSLIEKGSGIAILRTIINLGKELGMNTTAEGIETSEQLEFVQQEGCNFAQGYLFSRPVPVSEIECLYLLDSDKRFPRVA